MAKASKGATATTVGRPGKVRVHRQIVTGVPTVGRAKKTIGPPRPTVKRLAASELRRINALPYAQYAKATAKLNKGLTVQQQLDQGTFNHELVHRKK